MCAYLHTYLNMTLSFDAATKISIIIITNQTCLCAFFGSRSVQNLHILRAFQLPFFVVVICFFGIIFFHINFAHNRPIDVTTNSQFVYLFAILSLQSFVTSFLNVYTFVCMYVCVCIFVHLPS